MRPWILIALLLVLFMIFADVPSRQAALSQLRRRTINPDLPGQGSEASREFGTRSVLEDWN